MEWLTSGDRHHDVSGPKRLAAQVAHDVAQRVAGHVLDVVKHATTGMRSDDHLIQAEQRVVCRWRLGVKGVQTRTAQLAADQRLVERLFVDQC